MWKVSNAYKEAVVKPSREWKAEVTVDYKSGERAVFTDETLMGDIVIHSQMVSGDEGSNTFDIGAVPEKRIELTLIDTASDLHRYAGAKLTVKVSLKLESGEYETVPMGVFFVDASALSRVGTQISIVGYDGMVTFQYVISDELRKSLSGSLPFNAIRMLAEKSACGVTVQGLSSNPNTSYGLNFDSTQIVTGWDGIMWIAQLIGCFARINRENDLEFVPIKFNWEYLDEEQTKSRIVETRTITEDERYDGITFSDDRMHIVGLAMPGEEGYVTVGGTGGLESDANITILLEKNPLFCNQSGELTDTIISDKLTRILDKLTTVYFYAFQVDIENDPALDAGDVVRLTGGNINGTNKNNDLYGFITHNTWRYRGRQTITSTGQTPIISEDSTANGTTTNEKSYIQPKTQSEKLINSLVVGNNRLNEAVKAINISISNGIDRAKYLQTYDGSQLNPATALRTIHEARYSTNGGVIGYELGEQINNSYTAWNTMISGKMRYQKVTGEYSTRHPMESISYNWNAVPAKAIDGAVPDGLNFEMHGNSYGQSFGAQAELSCNGLWVSDGLPQHQPYDKVQLFYAHYSHAAGGDDVNEFVIAQMRFSAKEDGLHIECIHSSYDWTAKSAVIPWNGSASTSTASAVSAQSETQSAVQKSRTAAANAAEEPSYTYDDDGIHISFKGHTKLIPWDT